ncbi:hypothetical protein [Sphingopyxis terrae]|uniref:hypothetical protein n=1 Tax=Sphingopyxis terrae TaxID=33052 RepID=UPI0009EE7EEA|nr:hypothetical protein [Sphingopyxis terrae]
MLGIHNLLRNPKYHQFWTTQKGADQEDLRLVRFEQDNGGHTYYGTYTAYSGKAISSEILQTRDFETFELRPLVASVKVV